MADVIHEQDPKVAVYTNERLNNLSQRRNRYDQAKKTEHCWVSSKKRGKNHSMDHF